MAASLIKRVARFEKRNIEFYHPSPIFCTDNAAMIGCSAYYHQMEGYSADLTLNAIPYLGIDSI